MTDTRIETCTALPAADVLAIRALADAAARADSVAPLSEQALLRLQDPATQARHLLERLVDGTLLGYAQLEPAGAAELVVAPAARRQGLGGRLLHAVEEAADALPARPQLQVWAHGEHPGAAALAAARGYARTRVLLQLRRSLHEPPADPAWPADVQVRTFVPGHDEASWLAVNNAAFATHPEQGGWTLHDVEQREASDWFDPTGVFLAERAGELVGFHWTKVHRDEQPPIGEVYIVGVRPQDSGKGLGPALTLAGLHHLRDQGLTQVLLYVDEDNQPAVKTYERLGFARYATDVLYARPSGAT